MKIKKKFDKLNDLTFEADMLSRVMDDALKAHEEKDGITEICFLSEIVREKFRKIRALF